MIGAELMTAELVMNDSVFFTNTMKKLGLVTIFDSIPVYADNTLALHVAGNLIYNSRVKHVVLQHLFIQELVKQIRIRIYYVKTGDQLAGISTKLVSEQNHSFLIKLTSVFKA